MVTSKVNYLSRKEIDVHNVQMMPHSALQKAYVVSNLKHASMVKVTAKMMIIKFISHMSYKSLYPAGIFD